MNKEEKVVALILCYGLFDPERRTETEYFGYMHYLNQICKFLAQFKNLQAVVLCGGYTNGPNLPAESDSAASFVQEKLGYYGSPAAIFCERRSFNTPQNIFSAITNFIDLDYDHPGIGGEIIICCDKVRRFKATMIVDLLTEHFVSCLRLRGSEIAGFYRPDIHPHSTYFYQFVAAMSYAISDLFNIFGNGKSRLEEDLRKI